MRGEQNNVVPGVLFCASLIAWIYVILEYRQTLWMVGGTSIFLLVMVGVVISRVSVAWKSYQKKQSMLLDSRLTELQNQLMAANEENRESAKTNTYYTRKIGEALAGFEDELIDNQRKGNELMQRIITTQVKSTKVLVKYNEKNSSRVAGDVYDQYSQLEKTMDKSISNTNAELRRIGENIMLMQRAPQAVMYQSMPQNPVEPVMPRMTAAPVDADVATTMDEATDMPFLAADNAVSEDVQEDMTTGQEERSLEDPAIPDDILDMAAIPELTEEEAQMTAKHVADGVTEATAVSESPAPAVELPDDPNAQLSPDQIAALFASVGDAPAEAPTETAPAEATEPAVAPATEASVTEAAAATAPEAATPESPAPAVELPDDPNAQLSPDQIAALFASVGDAPAEEPTETAAAAELPDDPNAQLSPDQIAALFASIGS